MINDELDLSTGILYIPVPDDLKERSFIVGVAPFKWGNGKYRLWPNTTRCNLNDDFLSHECSFRQSEYLSKDGIKKPLQDIYTEETIEHKSSEHAYHTQKLLSYLEDLACRKHNEDFAIQNKIKVICEMIQELTTLPKGAGEILLPKNSTNSYESLVEAYLPKLEIQGGKLEFDQLCCSDYHVMNPDRGINLSTNLPYNHERMEFVLKMKIEQHPELKLQAKYLAYNNIMPVEYSRYDDVWASGSKGCGEGRLGLIIFALGKRYLKIEDGVSDGDVTYKHYEDAYNRTIKGQMFFGHDNIDRLVRNNNLNVLIPREIAGKTIHFIQSAAAGSIEFASSAVFPRKQSLNIEVNPAILNKIEPISIKTEPPMSNPTTDTMDLPFSSCGPSLVTLSQRPRF